MGRSTGDFEKLPDASAQDKIVDFAINLVDSNQDTARSRSPHYNSALFYSPSEAGDTCRSLQVFIPKEEFAAKLEYRSMLTFGDQADSGNSFFVIIGRDDTVRVSYFDSREPRLMDSMEVNEFYRKLLELEPALIPDIQS